MGQAQAPGGRLAIFPLGRALLLPRAYLPLHIFEPRYRAMVQDALIRDRRIGMIQPRDTANPPALYDVGCIGKIIDVEALVDGRFNIVLEGVSRFRVVRELDVATLFRQVECATDAYSADAEDPEPLPSVVRAAVEQEARRMAEARGYAIDWDQVSRLHDEGLVSGFAQAGPFDIAAKQALLESPTLAERAELLIQCLAFVAAGDDRDTLQ